jgi:hypothetical protein
MLEQPARFSGFRTVLTRLPKFPLGVLGLPGVYPLHRELAPVVAAEGAASAPCIRCDPVLALSISSVMAACFTSRIADSSDPEDRV